MGLFFDLHLFRLGKNIFSGMGHRLLWVDTDKFWPAIA
jgi:hypothetical protein